MDDTARVSEGTQYLYIPDLLANWPWKRRCNPLQQSVTEQGNTWLRSLAPFSAKSQHAFELCGFGSLAALVLPDAPREHLRVGVDLLNLFFVIDEYTDVAPAATVREMIDICIDALRHPHEPRPPGEVILGEMTRQFWARALTIASPGGAAHFLLTFEMYLESIVPVAKARDANVILSLKDYLAIRLEDVGVRPTYAISALTSSLPAHVYSSLREIIYLGCELITIDNDILSYNREQATGLSSYSIVTIVMHEHGLDINGAIRWLEKRASDVDRQFMELVRLVPSFGQEIDGEVAQFIDNIGNTRRAIWCWSLECGRYFGERGEEYAKAKRAPLLPQKIRDAAHKGGDITNIQEEFDRL